MEPTPFHHASLQGASSQAALVLYSPVQTQMQPTLPPFAETLGTSMDECVCVCGGASSLLPKLMLGALPEKAFVYSQGAMYGESALPGDTEGNGPADGCTLVLLLARAHRPLTASTQRPPTGDSPLLPSVLRSMM